MAHGNFSDLVALALIGLSVKFIFFPHVMYQDMGPVKVSG